MTGRVVQPPPPGPANPEHPLFISLRDVINQGATLFNQKNDFAGCYRVYQGALIAVRPYIEDKGLLNHIDKSIQSAEKLPSMADRAFALRAVLDSIRDFYRSPKTGPGPGGPGPTKKPEIIPDPKKVDARPVQSVRVAIISLTRAATGPAAIAAYRRGLASSNHNRGGQPA